MTPIEEALADSLIRKGWEIRVEVVDWGYRYRVMIWHHEEDVKNAVICDRKCRLRVALDSLIHWVVARESKKMNAA